MAKIHGNLSDSLEKAKEAFNKEKKLRTQREQQNLADSINMELSYCV